MSKPIAIAVSMSLAIAVGVSSASTSSPAPGEWSGKFKDVSPKVALTFMVAKKGGSRRVVSLASNPVQVPCGFTGQTADVAAMPDAKVSSTGKFKAVVSRNVNAGKDRTTVSGKFTSSRAAAGTVQFDTSGSTGHPCKFTLEWTAAQEPPAPPVRGANYKGATSDNQAGGGSPVTFHVSASGKKLTEVKFTVPAPFNCAGDISHAIHVTGHGVPIRHKGFSFTEKSGNSHLKTLHTISGEFLTRHRAAGEVVLEQKQRLGSGPTKCRDSNTWTAHA